MGEFIIIYAYYTWMHACRIPWAPRMIIIVMMDAKIERHEEGRGIPEFGKRS